jgi:hypothetical protein
MTTVPSQKKSVRLEIDGERPSSSCMPGPAHEANLRTLVYRCIRYLTSQVISPAWLVFLDLLIVRRCS